MTLGQKLKELRTKKGLTQKDLADQLHVSFQTISKWESDINEPDLKTLKELSKIYGCSVSYILCDDLAEQNEDNKKPIEEKNTPTKVINKTIIIHQNEKHVCAKCGKEIPEDELVSEDITKKERHGRITRTVSVGQTYYHKGCLDEIKKKSARRTKNKNQKSLTKYEEMLWLGNCLRCCCINYCFSGFSYE